MKTSRRLIAITLVLFFGIQIGSDAATEGLMRGVEPATITTSSIPSIRPEDDSSQNLFLSKEIGLPKIRFMRQLITTSLKQHITFDRKDLGLSDVLYNTGSVKKIKLMVLHDTTKYIYNLKNDPAYMAFPMQLGNGSYKFEIYENTTDTKYRKTYSNEDALNLKDKNIVFVTSMQQIEWYHDDTAIVFAQKLIDNYKREHYKNQVTTSIYGLDAVQLTDDEIIELFYNYVVKNISYDYNKIKGLDYDYIPDIDLILKDQAGICYDYSVLLAAMLRSQGIPTKLIKGYSSFTDVYHAWNEIYIRSEKKWVIVDTTYDSYMYKKKRAYTFEKSREDYSTSYEY